MNAKQLSALAFFLLLLTISFQLIGIFHLFLISILWAVILAIVVFPVYRFLFRLFKGQKNLAAALVTLMVIIVTVGPMVFFSGALVREVADFYGRVGGWIEARGYDAVWVWLQKSPFGGIWDEIKEKTAALNIEIVPLTVKFLEKFTNAIAGHLQTGAKNFLVFVFDYLITIFALFFFLRDGEALAKGFEDLFPLSKEHKEAIIGRLEQTVSAVVRGVGITGITQGILAGLAFWMLGVPYPLFLGLLTGFLAFVPLGGAVMVWLPSAATLFFSHHPGRALILFLWGVLVISMVDNFLKPMLIGEKTKIPTLFLFFAVLGGLTYYGFIGVFLGPVMLSLFLTLIRIYRKEYSS